MKRSCGLILLCAAVGLCGCIERELYITSEPAGATVYVSDVEVGATPVTTPFTWHGEYEIILRKDGYETIVAARNVPAKLYELPPIDLLSAMAPWTYHDRRHFHFEMSELDLPDDAELIDSARELRERTLEPVEP